METPPPNPFEPPRTTDLDATAAAAPGARVVSDAALDELSAAAPWVRRFWRVTAVSIAVQLFGVITLVRRFGWPFTRTAALLAGVGIAVFALFMVVLHRYAAASQRFSDGDDDAMGPLLATQALYFKLAGVLIVLGVVAWVIQIAAGIAAGRWLAWVHT